MKHLLLSLSLIQICLTTSAQDFTYEYKGQTLTYTVIDEDAMTCKLKEGKSDYPESSNLPGNYVRDDVVIPSEAGNFRQKFKVIEIPNYAFSNCKGLTSVTIPNSVTSIGKYAFYGCKKLTSIKIPNSVTYINYKAFADCTGLTSVTIPNSVTDIGYYAFYGCTGLTSVNINDIVAWCKIKFGSDVTSNPLFFAHNLYLNGEKITNLVIPDNITYIGNHTFSGYTSLTSVTIPNSVTGIGAGAFEYCSNLVSITIPKSVTSIGDYTFLGCTSLTEIYLYGLTPPECKEYFQRFDNQTYKEATLYVPHAALETYKTAYEWCYFFNIKEFDPTGIKNVIANGKGKAMMYDLQGNKLMTPQKGLNIINGKKVMMK